MELSLQQRVGVAFLNAGSAFSDPLAAAQWWGSVRVHALEAIPLAECPKPRFDAALTASLSALNEAALAAIEPIRNGQSAPESALHILSAALTRGMLQLAGAPPRLVHSVREGRDSVLFPLAHAIAGLMVTPLERLRRCEHEACAAYFWDNTKNGSRRWCSLACMERVRAPRRRLRR